MSNRIPRINQLIKKELSQILWREVDFPKNFLVTVTRVETSVDLNRAKVYISVMPEGETSKVLQILDKLIYFLQQKLNKRLKMRPTPRIQFVEEKRTVEAGRIEELLEKIHGNNSKIKNQNAK